MGLNDRPPAFRSSKYRCGWFPVPGCRILYLYLWCVKILCLVAGEAGRLHRDLKMLIQKREIGCPISLPVYTTALARPPSACGQVACPAQQMPWHRFLSLQRCQIEPCWLWAHQCPYGQSLVPSGRRFPALEPSLSQIWEGNHPSSVPWAAGSSQPLLPLLI